MKFDRELQKRILSALLTQYPNGAYEPWLKDELDDIGPEILLPNLIYLEQHRLIDSGYKVQEYLGDEREWHQLRQTTITAEGIDFITDDGGLGAILKTVTVRLDAGQFAELLASKVESLPSIAPEERSELAKAIRKLPATAVEKIAEKLLDWSVDHAGDVLPLLRTLVGMGA